MLGEAVTVVMVVSCWASNAPMSTVPLTIAEPAALVGGQGVATRIDGQGNAAGVNGRAAGQEGDGLGRSAVVPGPVGVKTRVDADQVGIAVVEDAEGIVDPD